MMKKWVSVVLCLSIIVAFGVFALGSGESTETDQGADSATNDATGENTLGEYALEVASCRLAKTYDNKNAVIVKYLFTNNSDDEAAFYTAFDDTVYQNGVGLNAAYVMDDSAKYSADNQTKKIKKGATLEVEVAYELNDTTTDVVVEVERLFSLDESKITKTFSIK